MALSTNWSDTVTVQMNKDGKPFQIVQPNLQTLPLKSVAGVCAAAGSPLTIRHRSQIPPAETGPIPSEVYRKGPGSLSSASSATKGFASTAIVPSRGSLLRVAANSLSFMLTGGTARTGCTFHSTYWVPDSNCGEVGLLELLHRRSGSGDQESRSRYNVLVQSRPLEELQRNFSVGADPDVNIDLSHPAFRLSKTALAVERMNQTLSAAAQQTKPFSPASSAAAPHRAGGSSPPSITIRPQDLQQAVVENLQTIQEDEYFLVRYRDYSRWAVEHYPSLVRRENQWKDVIGDNEYHSAPSAWQGGGGYNYPGSTPQSSTARRPRRRGGRGKEGYVEQCFVVHVGTEAGELIPITEQQLLFGLDIIQRELIRQMPSYGGYPPPGGMCGVGETATASSHSQYQVDGFYRSLNRDQFHSLWGVLGEGFIPIAPEGEEQLRKEHKAGQKKLGHYFEFLSRGGGAGGVGDLFYTPPAWYDWRPSALRKRIKHQLQLQSQAVGAVVIKIGAMALAGMILYHTVPGVSAAVNAITGRGGHNREVERLLREAGGRSRGRYESAQRWDSESSRGWGIQRQRTFFGSILMGPKDFFDYLLAPADSF